MLAAATSPTLCGLQRNPQQSLDSPLTASQYIMVIRGVTLELHAAGSCRAVLRQLTG